ncbi:hypothetical protein [Nesterenkonia ebinurensis]|uniref:hypothetical protein n=1 Tax=Nesterenkonia ebinurensis TaxID=2608252 RepID=UPI00123D1AFB|nr:hypothetical protein [Nesterenkonia ebinurensis]
MSEYEIPTDEEYDRLPTRLEDGRYKVVLRSRGGEIRYSRDPLMARLSQHADRKVLLLDRQLEWFDLPWWKRLVTRRPMR